MATQRTTVIIPNYNGAHRLGTLLQSLSQQKRLPAAIVLVDNGSTDESCELFSASASSIPVKMECVKLERNFGFARAVNHGIEASTTEFVALVNNDVHLDGLWLQQLEDALVTEPTSQFACPLLCRSQDPHHIDGAFDLLARSACAARALHGEAATHPAASAPRRVQFPPMTAALFRRDVFGRVGLLDESYESYLEDVDFGLRAAIAGLHGVFVPSARGLHAGSATLGAWSARATRLIACNQLRLIGRHYPGSLLRSWWWPIALGNLLFVLLAAKRGQGLAALRGKVDGLKAFREARPHIRQDQKTVQLLTEAIHAAERELHSLVTRRSNGQATNDTFWRIYFRLCPLPTKKQHPSCQHEEHQQ